MVIIPGGIISPDSHHIFDSCNLCDACHNVNIPKVDYMAQATVGGAFNARKGESKINEHTATVAHRYSTQGPDIGGHPG